jgi:hypothetical protein
VFCTATGTLHRDFRTTFRRIVRRAGNEDFTCHGLRHFFASRLAMTGVDLPTVQALMRHKNVTMTRRYTHLSANHKQQAVALLEPFAEKAPQQFSQQDGLSTLALPSMQRVCRWLEEKRSPRRRDGISEHAALY